MRDNELEVRTKQFALRVIKFVSDLPNKTHLHHPSRYARLETQSSQRRRVEEKLLKFCPDTGRRPYQDTRIPAGGKPLVHPRGSDGVCLKQRLHCFRHGPWLPREVPLRDLCASSEAGGEHFP
jgi:hypothetical protein